jgi:hypothetical protein
LEAGLLLAEVLDGGLMRSYEQIMTDARGDSPFSNHTMWEIWADRWCYECANDSEELVDQGKGCPLIMAALMGKTPREWTAATEEDDMLGNYECSEFRRRPEPGDDPPPEPPPPPPCDGQVDMFEVFADQIVEHVESLVPILSKESR